MDNRKQKTAIVFGGAGFIGSHLLEDLSKSGKYGRLLSVDIRAPKFSVSGVEYCNGDVRKPIDLQCHITAPDIYNLAAVHQTPGHEPWEYYDTNVLGAIHICEFAKRLGVNQIVFTSSISVYGPSEEMLDEESETRPESAYGYSKLYAEKIHRSWQASHSSERRLIIARPAVVYGFKETGNFTRLANSIRRGHFIYPGRRDTIKSCGYVADLVKSFEFMLACDQAMITYNFCHLERLTIEDICEAFCSVAGYKLPRLKVPLSVMLSAGLAFEFLAMTGVKTNINRARIWKVNRSTNIYPKCLAEMGFHERSLDDALKDWQSRSPEREFA